MHDLGPSYPWQGEVNKVLSPSLALCDSEDAKSICDLLKTRLGSIIEIPI